jgi:putative heme-binding domain-containing protein
VLARYRAALERKGGAAHGRIVFETAGCAACHRAGDLGNEVGLNMSTIRAWSPEQVLINILDPNREVTPNFIGHTVATRDGRAVFGAIVEESAASVTLKRVDGGSDTILRADIATLASTGLSLMPEGLEAAISVEQMADLIAFLLAPL